MLQKTFSIYADNLEGCGLFIEAGSRHIACWCKDGTTGAAKAFEFFQFDEDEKPLLDVLQDVRMSSKLMDLPVNPEAIIWDSNEAICIPAQFYNEGLSASYLNVMFGDGSGEGQVLAQPLDKYIILSRQKAGNDTAFRKHFSIQSFYHKFFVLLKKYIAINNQNGENRVYVIFYPSHLIITAIKAGVLQIIKCIDYSTSEDALYSIMHVCNEHALPLNNTPIIVSGLIDTSSNLYNTLFSYLETFTFDNATAESFAAEGFAEYPAHYFLPFIQG